MARVRTALVGCGKVGQVHATALRELAESQFVAVCDADASRAQGFAEKYGVRAYTGVPKMLADAGVEALAVCTPHPLHAEPAVRAAEAGVHVLVEKPMAASLADCDAMIAAAKRGGVKLGVVSQRRWYEPVRRMKEAIDASKIGRPILGSVLMLSWRDRAYYESDPWRGKWDSEGGGVLLNQSSHHLDILQWMMGPIEEISGYWGNLSHPYIEVEDTALAMIRFKNGGLGWIAASLCQKPGIYTKIHVHGANGASVGAETDSGATFVAGLTDSPNPPILDLWTVPGEQHLLDQFNSESRRKAESVDIASHYHKLQIQDFLRAVRDGGEPLVTAEDGRIVVEMCTAIYRSNRERSPVTFPVPSAP